jgi:DMSO/TMAO reductase YedYZ molybdopterin-dependent catalytic subunit
MKKMQKWINTPLIVVSVVCSLVLIASCQPKSAEDESDELDIEEILAGNSTVVHKSGVKLVLTPIEEMGITGQAQDVDINKYRLTVNGLVEKPLSLDYEDILSYPSITEIAVLNCPDFFVDVGVWTGVPLMNILNEA